MDELRPPRRGHTRPGDGALTAVTAHDDSIRAVHSTKRARGGVSDSLSIVVSSRVARERLYLVTLGIFVCVRRHVFSLGFVHQNITPASSAPRLRCSASLAPTRLRQCLARTWRGERRAIEQMTQPKSSKCEDGVAIAGRLISRPQMLLLLASAGVASVV